MTPDMSAHFHHWLDHPPDLLGLSRANPEEFPYLLESSAGGPLGSHSLLLHATGPALVSQAGHSLTGPGEGDSFFERLADWFGRESLPRGEVGGNDALPFCGGWFVYLGYEMAAETSETSSTAPVRTRALAHRTGTRRGTAAKVVRTIPVNEPAVEEIFDSYWRRAGK